MKKTCEDKNCPVHSNLKLHGRAIVGKIVGTKANKTVRIEFTRRSFLRKYERHEERRSRIQVHHPACIELKEGDMVRVMECKPISKTKNFVVIKNESS